MTEVFVAAGSNLRARAPPHLRLNELTRRFASVHASRWYRSRADDDVGADYVNLAVRLTTGLSAREVRG